MADIVVQVLCCLVQSEDEYLIANMNWLMGSLCELVRCRDEKVRLALHKVMVQKVSQSAKAVSAGLVGGGGSGEARLADWSGSLMIVGKNAVCVSSGSCHFLTSALFTHSQFYRFLHC